MLVNKSAANTKWDRIAESKRFADFKSILQGNSWTLKSNPLIGLILTGSILTVYKKTTSAIPAHSPAQNSTAHIEQMSFVEGGLGCENGLLISPNII